MTDQNLIIDRNCAAILLVHMQRDVVGGDGKGGQDGCVDTTDADIVKMRATLATAGEMLKEARRRNLPIFRSAWGREQNGTFANLHGPLYAWANQLNLVIRGTRGYEFCDEVAPLPGEPVLPCETISAFAGCHLSSLLTARGINTIAVGGIPTQWAVEGTVRDAADRGYRVIVLEDCCASGLEHRHRAAMEILRQLVAVMPFREFFAALGPET
jgi:nicotinamidase-related amidase